MTTPVPDSYDVGRLDLGLLPFHTVVCATDLTSTSAGCVPVAYALVADRGTVHLVHVLGRWATAGGRDILHVHEELVRLAPAGAEARGVRTIVHLLEGDDAVRPILRLTLRVGAEAVVLGTHARGPVGRLFWGSVASEVAAAVPTLALLVSPPRTRSATDAGAAAPPRSVLLPLELSPFEGDAVHVAYRLIDDGGTVHLLHAWELEYAESDVDGVAFPYHPRGEEREGHERDLRERLARVVPGWASARGIRTDIHVVEEGDPVDAIRSLADRLDVDCLVLPTHGRRGVERLWAGSVAESALRAGRAAVVVRRATAPTPPASDRDADAAKLAERRG